MAGVRRILVVDDEPALLRLLEQFLTRLGYQVEAYSSAPAALRTFAARPAEFALVLADLTMPEISGQDLVAQLLELNPGIRILLCSGDPFDYLGLPAKIQNQVRFLQKPFASNALADAVQELAGRPEAE